MSHRMRWAIALVIVWLAACVPLALSEILPLVDYPGHLARVHLLADDPAGAGAFYQTSWGILPNLALEAIAVPLAQIVPATVALRLFCALLFGLVIWGGARLNRAATGSTSPVSLVPALLVYNVVFAFGFLNFLFGLGLALLALARHIETRDASLSRRVLGEVGFGLALFFSHIVALAVYAAAAAVHDAVSRPRPRSRRLLRDGAILASGLLAPVAFLLVSPTRSEAALAVFHPLSAKLDKLLAIPRTGQGAWDTFFALATLALIAALFLFRLVRINRALALVALALAAGFLLAPYRFATAENVDTRLPLVFLLIAAAALELTCSGPRARALTAALAALFAVRVATTAVHHLDSGRALDSIRADLHAVPAGSLLFTAREATAPSWSPDDWHPPLTHAGELLLLDRPVFSATLFAHPTQQPLVRTRPFAGLAVPEPVGVLWQPHLDAYGKNLLRMLEDARRPEPAYVLFLKGPGTFDPGPLFQVVVDRPRYAILRLLD